jgi:GrpB-like predicted nucleotidyltransferase (UPF0157 family)
VDEEQTPVEYLEAVTIGEPTRVDGRVELVDYDPMWPELYRREEQRIRTALAEHAVLVEHAGSTAVPGLAAKPIVDIVLAVPDSTDEDAYVPALERAGYVLRIREPDWFEHRLFKRREPAVNLHVFSAGCEEIDRMLAFRDHLLADEPDRELYERTKRELAAREWAFVQHYADAKTEVVRQIMRRAAPQ